MQPYCLFGWLMQGFLEGWMQIPVTRGGTRLLPLLVQAFLTDAGERMHGKGSLLGFHSDELSTLPCRSRGEHNLISAQGCQNCHRSLHVPVTLGRF